MGRGGDAQTFGRAMARMHLATPDDPEAASGKFGFPVGSHHERRAHLRDIAVRAAQHNAYIQDARLLTDLLGELIQTPTRSRGRGLFIDTDREGRETAVLNRPNLAAQCLSDQAGSVQSI